jgi:hypothetical protein
LAVRPESLEPLLDVPLVPDEPEEDAGREVDGVGSRGCARSVPVEPPRL